MSCSYDYVTKVHPDAKLDAPLLRHVGLAVSHPTLDLRGTADGIDDTRKFREHAVAGVLDDTAVMLGDLRIDQLAEMPLQAFVRTLLIGAHQPRIACDIGGEDRGKAAGRGHGWAGPLVEEIE